MSSAERQSAGEKDYGGFEFQFTVFTPTYNRADTLSRVYDSLRAQTYRNFEWLIVDDGSTDETHLLVEVWQRQADFSIRCLRQENRGKHVAVNRGVREARGELFLILDSDDGCVSRALERLLYHWEAIPEGDRQEYSAVTGLVASPDGTVDGTRFPGDGIDSDPIELRRLGVRGEKWGFQRTDVMRSFPYPVFQGERYVAPSVVWNRIGRRFKTKYVNEILRIHYRTAGSLSSSSAPRIESPRGATLAYRELLLYGGDSGWRNMIRGYGNYIRYAFHAKIGLREQAGEIPSIRMWCLALPLGLALFLRDQCPVW